MNEDLCKLKNTGGTNWLLVSGIFSALSCMEENHNWDLSIGENASLAESLYSDLAGGLPDSINKWQKIFDRANIKCWGEDHACDKLTSDELKTFIWSMADCYYGGDDYDKNVNMFHYTESLGLGASLDYNDQFVSEVSELCLNDLVKATNEEIMNDLRAISGMDKSSGVDKTSIIYYKPVAVGEAPPPIVTLDSASREEIQEAIKLLNLDIEKDVGIPADQFFKDSLAGSSETNS